MITKYSNYIKENVLNNQFFKTYEETKSWLDEMFIENYTINYDLTVDVDGSVDLFSEHLPYIPIQFGIVNGNFTCSKNKLTTLIGSPKEVYGNFYCSNNKIINFIGLTKEIKGNIICQNNKLTSLEGLSIYNLKNNTNQFWYICINHKSKEEYFDKHLEDNPEIINLIDFHTTLQFKEKWKHLFNANKFDLI